MPGLKMSVCGVICSSDCRAYQEECAGCNELEGKVSWAEFYALEHCPIYSCVQAKAITDCGICGEAPCSVWMQTRNPSASDSEFEADLQSRLANLRKIER